MKQLMAAIALEEAIATYSTTKNDSGTCIHYEVTDGLRVLEVHQLAPPHSATSSLTKPFLAHKLMQSNWRKI
jgi:hypothetical protein